MMHLTIQQLVAQTDGELTGPSLTLVENHIAECETCWHEMERLAELDALLASIITVDPGEAFFEDLLRYRSHWVWLGEFLHPHEFARRFPQAVFFGGQLVFMNESRLGRVLHNFTVFALQREFFRQGLPFLIVPIRV